MIAIYQPRYSKVYAALKQVSSGGNRTSIDRLVYQPVNCPCSSNKQVTFDIALARIGGMKQLLMLIAQVI